MLNPKCLRSAFVVKACVLLIAMGTLEMAVPLIRFDINRHRVSPSHQIHYSFTTPQTLILDIFSYLHPGMWRKTEISHTVASIRSKVGTKNRNCEKKKRVGISTHRLCRNITVVYHCIKKVLLRPNLAAFFQLLEIESWPSSHGIMGWWRRDFGNY